MVSWHNLSCDQIDGLWVFSLAIYNNLTFFNSHSHHYGFYWGHQCSWTHTAANSMQVSIIQSQQFNFAQDPKITK